MVKRICDFQAIIEMLAHLFQEFRLHFLEHDDAIVSTHHLIKVCDFGR